MKEIISQIAKVFLLINQPLFYVKSITSKFENIGDLTNSNIVKQLENLKIYFEQKPVDLARKFCYENLPIIAKLDRVISIIKVLKAAYLDTGNKGFQSKNLMFI